MPLGLDVGLFHPVLPTLEPSQFHFVMLSLAYKKQASVLRGVEPTLQGLVAAVRRVGRGAASASLPDLESRATHQSFLGLRIRGASPRLLRIRCLTLTGLLWERLLSHGDYEPAIGIPALARRVPMRSGCLPTVRAFSASARPGCTGGPHRLSCHTTPARRCPFMVNGNCFKLRE